MITNVLKSVLQKRCTMSLMPFLLARAILKKMLLHQTMRWMRFGCEICWSQQEIGIALLSGFHRPKLMKELRPLAPHTMEAPRAFFLSHGNEVVHILKVPSSTQERTGPSLDCHNSSRVLIITLLNSTLKSSLRLRGSTVHIARCYLHRRAYSRRTKADQDSHRPTWHSFLNRLRCPRRVRMECPHSPEPCGTGGGGSNLREALPTVTKGDN